MAQSSPPFDEEMLSGFLDGTLPHRDMQRMRLQLEEYPELRRELDEMRAIRETALGTRFVAPEPEIWGELPKTKASYFSRSLGWMVLCSWLIVVTGMALWRFLSSHEDPLEIFIVLGLPGAMFLLFMSVLMDRLSTLRDDRYHRDVHR